MWDILYYYNNIWDICALKLLIMRDMFLFSQLILGYWCILLLDIVPHWLEIGEETFVALYNMWKVLGINNVMGTWLTSHIGENESKEVSLIYKLINGSTYKCVSLTFNIWAFVPHRDKSVQMLAIYLYKLMGVLNSLPQRS